MGERWLAHSDVWRSRSAGQSTRAGLSGSIGELTSRATATNGTSSSAAGAAIGWLSEGSWGTTGASALLPRRRMTASRDSNTTAVITSRRTLVGSESRGGSRRCGQRQSRTFLSPAGPDDARFPASVAGTGSTTAAVAVRSSRWTGSTSCRPDATHRPLTPHFQAGCRGGATNSACAGTTSITDERPLSPLPR